MPSLTLAVANDKDKPPKETTKSTLSLDGKLNVYRMPLFGRAAAAIKIGDVPVWLDYNNCDDMKNALKDGGRHDGQVVQVSGSLEFRVIRIASDKASQK